MDRYSYQLPDLYFLHIPKTAGTSLKYWLYDFYGANEVLKIENLAELPNVTREEVNQARLISGHFGQHLFDWLDKPRLSITWLRDPIDRSLSNFRYTQQQFPQLVAEAKRVGREDWIRHYERCQRMSLAELIDQGRYVGFLDNLQVRHLANHIADSQPLFVDESTLSRAIQNLETLSFTGLCELMDQSIDLCCAQLGFPYHPLQFTFNVTPTAIKRNEDDNAIREKLEHVERFDRELYRVARTRFERQFVQLWEELTNDHKQIPVRPAEFENLRDFLSEVCRQYSDHEVQLAVKQFINRKFAETRRVPLVNAGELNFIDPVIANNWHPRWPGTSSDSVVRWAGPSNLSTVLFPFEPGQDYEVMFFVNNRTDPYFVESMAIFVNGHPVPVKIRPVFDAPAQALVWFLVPRAALNPANQMTEVAIQTQGEIQPSLNVDGHPKISFSTSGFRFRASPQNSSLTSTWLSDFAREQAIRRSNEERNPAPISTLPYMPVENSLLSAPTFQI